MKYFSLAGVCLLGFAAAAPAWDVDSYNAVDEDCFEEDVQAAQLYEDSYLIPDMGYEADPECDDDPIPETSILEFEPVFIDPPTVFVEDVFVDNIYEEECVDEEGPDTTVPVIDTTAPTYTEYPDCDGDYNSEEFGDIGDYGIYEDPADVLAYAAYDMDDIILNTGYESENDVASIEECDE